MPGQREKVTFSACLLLLITFIAGCNSDEVSEKSNHSLSLAGESESWELESYEITVSPEMQKAGNGTLTMKNNTGYKTDYLHIETHTVIDEQDKVIQQKQISGKTEVAHTGTGAIEGEIFLDENGKPIELEAVDDIYMVVEWRDVKKNETVSEKIDLFN